MKRRGQREKRNRKSRKGKGNVHDDVSETSRGQVFKSATPGVVVPEISYVKLHYFAQYTINNATLKYADNRFVMNGVYDVDPLVGSTAIAGFSELAAFYQSYRALKCTVRVDFSNLEAFPVNVYMLPSRNPSTDPGSNNVGGLDWLMNPLSKYKQLSAVGGMDRCTLGQTVDFPTVYSKQVLTDDSYSAAVTANPSLKLYHIVGVTSGTNLVSGIAVTVHYTIWTQFYTPKLLLT